MFEPPLFDRTRAPTEPGTEVGIDWLLEGYWMVGRTGMQIIGMRPTGWLRGTFPSDQDLIELCRSDPGIQRKLTDIVRTHRDPRTCPGCGGLVLYVLSLMGNTAGITSLTPSSPWWCPACNSKHKHAAASPMSAHQRLSAQNALYTALNKRTLCLYKPKDTA